MSCKPAPLYPGDTIGVAALAGPVTPEEMEPGIRLLESKGFQVHLSPHLYEKKDYLAGDDAMRLAELHRLFGDRGIKAIFCARGGYGTLRLLPHIDFDLIHANPKIFMGYSDITALLWAFYHKSDLITFHGPMIKSLGTEPLQSLEPFETLFTSSSPLTLDLTGGHVIAPGKTKGKLLGGNLSLICHLIGTPYVPDLQGALLFIEDIGEPLYRIDRMLTYLRLSGVLDQLAGILLGCFEQCEDQDQLWPLFADRFDHLNIPICSGLPVGHGAMNCILPLGTQASMDTEQMTLTLDEPWTV